jgi:hypothetical protein
MNSKPNCEEKSSIKTLESFLNDSSWMDHFGYNFFSKSEVAELYLCLKEDKKLNSNREKMVEYALTKFPHRKKTKSNLSVLKILLIVLSFITIGCVILLVG